MKIVMLTRANNIQEEMQKIELSLKSLRSFDDSIYSSNVGPNEISFCGYIRMAAPTPEDFIFIKEYMIDRYEKRLVDLQAEFDKL